MKMCAKKLISPHAHKLIKVAQGLRSKHYSSIVATEPMKLGHRTSCDDPNLFRRMRTYLG
jgi:hypothetical protein